jgi:23S rRNA (guanine2445-N2)-methyltransferase / 23S rRNA (guanine2069-N7)-methyltransferase
VRAAVDKAFPIHVRTLTGLEPVLVQELSELGGQAIEQKSRLVTCAGNLEFLYKANLWCRTAIRVLRPVAEFPATEEKALYEGVKKIDWTPWLAPDGRLAVDAHVYSSFTTHSLYLAQLTKDAVVDQFREATGRRPSVDLEFPDLRIVLALYQDTAQVFVDASGESLHRRGYRKKAGEAPLNEALAAGIIKLSGWDGTRPLLDPMCGSGTLGIEAGLMVRNVAPGLLRKQFGFQRWSDYDAPLWERLVAEARAAIRPEATAPIIGVEIQKEVAQIARENVERAGLTGLVQICDGDFFSWESVPETGGTLVMNPPYDERLPVDNVAELYQRIGDRLKQRYGGWTSYVLSGNLEAAKYIGLKSSRRTVLYNGAIECRLLEMEIRPGGLTAEQLEMRQRSRAPEENPQWREKADIFGNRVRKNFKHLGKWAKREKVTCWRVYDWDIPELAFVIDLYEDRMHFAEIVRNYDHSPIEHSRYVQFMVKTAADILGVPPEKTYFKKRKPQQSGGFQYTPHDETGEFVEVQEGGHKFLVNLADYLDVGLFLDHRKTRGMVQKQSNGKDVLNLFAYTGSFTVYAAAGGAKSTTTVDTSRTYLEWAQRNLILNGFTGATNELVRSDSFEFLERDKHYYDVAIVDPPTRSVNRSSGRVFDVQPDHVRLLHLVLDRIRAGGKVFFSTNYRTFQLDEQGLKQGRSIDVKEITSQTIPLDFERKASHRCWLIEKHGPLQKPV